MATARCEVCGTTATVARLPNGSLKIEPDLIAKVRNCKNAVKPDDRRGLMGEPFTDCPSLYDAVLKAVPPRRGPRHL
jgi:hypothetical protein